MRIPQLPVTLQGSDPNGLPITYMLNSYPTNGSLSGTVPNLTYTPNQNYSGTDSFTYSVTDGQLTSPQATVSITVNPVYLQPTANAQSVSLNENAALTITLTGSDQENLPLTYSVMSLPQHGTLMQVRRQVVSDL